MTEYAKLVSLDVEETIMVEQDKVTIDAIVNAQGKEIKDVQKILKEQALKVIALIKKHKKVEYYTKEQHVVDNYKKTSKEATKDGYKGSYTIGLISYDFEAINELYNELYELVQFENITTSVSSKLIKEKEVELTEDAIANFSKKAKLIAKSFNFNDFGVEDINVSTGTGERNNYFSAQASNSALLNDAENETNEVLIIEPRQERISVSVAGKIKLLTIME